MEIEVYGHKFDLRNIPMESIAALVVPTLRHKLGNEVASKVTTHKESEAFKALSEADQTAAIERVQTEARAAIAKAVHDGTLGTPTARGPRGTALDTVMRQIATEQIRAQLAVQNKPMLKGKETVVVRNPATNTIENLTLADLIKRRIEGKYGESIRKDALKRMDAAKKAGANAGADEEGALLLDF